MTERAEWTSHANCMCWHIEKGDVAHFSLESDECRFCMVTCLAMLQKLQTFDLIASFGMNQKWMQFGSSSLHCFSSCWLCKMTALSWQTEEQTNLHSVWHHLVTAFWWLMCINFRLITLYLHSHCIPIDTRFSQGIDWLVDTPKWVHSDSQFMAMLMCCNLCLL